MRSAFGFLGCLVYIALSACAPTAPDLRGDSLTSSKSGSKNKKSGSDKGGTNEPDGAEAPGDPQDPDVQGSGPEGPAPAASPRCTGADIAAFADRLVQATRQS